MAFPRDGWTPYELLDAEQSKSVCHNRTLRRQKVCLILVGESVRVLADEFREDKIYYTSCKRTVSFVKFVSHASSHDNDADVCEKLTYIARVRPLVLFQTRGLGVRFFAPIEGAFIDPFGVQ